MRFLNYYVYGELSKYITRNIIGLYFDTYKDINGHPCQDDDICVTIKVSGSNMVSDVNQIISLLIGNPKVNLIVLIPGCEVDEFGNRKDRFIRYCRMHKGLKDHFTEVLIGDDKVEFVYIRKDI